MGACSARKPDLVYFKWWGRWQTTAVALQYATRRTDPAVIAPTIVPAWERGTGPSPEPSRVGLASICGLAMYLELARVVDSRTRRKSRAPHIAHRRRPRSRSAAVGVVPGASQSHEFKDG